MSKASPLKFIGNSKDSILFKCNTFMQQRVALSKLMYLLKLKKKQEIKKYLAKQKKIIGS